MINQQLLELLVCPKSGESLEYDKKNNVLKCKASGLVYPIVNGIPVLIEEEAEAEYKE